MKWETISEEVFRKEFLGSDFIRHTVMVCEPPITYFWNKTWFATDDRADYEKAVGRVILDEPKVFQRKAS